MKDILILIILALFVNCSGNYNYQIEGTVKDNSLDGKYIYLQQVSNNELITLDSALIKDAHFSFKGEQQSPVIRELNFLHQELNGFSPVVFVLQSGKMEAMIDTVSYVSGTEQNDRLHAYFKELNYYQRRMSDLVVQYQFLALSDELNDSIQIAFQEWYDSIRDELNQISYDFILVNSNSVAGGLVFLQSYSQLTPNQIETILNSAGPLFRTIQGVDIVEEQMRREKRVAIGNQYIDFTLTNLQGDSVALSSLVGEGKWVLLDFWASWCLPCEQDMPFLQNIYTRFESKGLTLVSISLDANWDEWQQGVAHYQMPWLQLSDLRGWENEAAVIYGIQTLPYTILINPEGVIIAKGIRHQALEEELKKIFAPSLGS